MVHDLLGMGSGSHHTVIFGIAIVFGFGWLALRFMGGGKMKSVVTESAIITGVIAGFLQVYVTLIL